MSTPKGSADLVDTAQAAGNFGAFFKALKTAGLVDILKGPGPFTLFAPTDEAFTKLGSDTMEALLEDKKRLAAVLQYHVLRGTLNTWDLPRGRAKTLEGHLVNIAATDDGLTIDLANITEPNIASRNGVIHAIDTVMIPGAYQPAREAAAHDSPWNGTRKTAPTTRR